MIEIVTGKTRNNTINFEFNLDDWDITALFKNTIWAEYLDEIEGGGISKGGITIPENVKTTPNFLRVARVLKAGPDCSPSIIEGAFLLVPPVAGILGIKKGPNGKSIFLKEDQVMAVIEPQSENAINNLNTL